MAKNVQKISDREVGSHARYLIAHLSKNVGEIARYVVDQAELRYTKGEEMSAARMKKAVEELGKAWSHLMHAHRVLQKLR